MSAQGPFHSDHGSTVEQIMKEDGYIDVFRALANVTTVNVLFRQEAFALGIELVDSPRSVAAVATMHKLTFIFAGQVVSRKKHSTIIS